MYTVDDRHTANLADRLIAAVIGGLGGFFVGFFVAFLVSILFGSDFGLAWWMAAGFAVFAFLAPSRSRDIWSVFWAAFLRVARIFYRGR